MAVRKALLCMLTVALAAAFAVIGLPGHATELSSTDVKVSVAANLGPSKDHALAQLIQEANLRSVGINPSSEQPRDSQAIAVVDTGVDPTVPWLRAAGGASRVISWHDLTQEGRVYTIQLPARNGQITMADKVLNVDGLPSASGVYCAGMLPAVLVGQIEVTIPFVAFDPETPGVYRAVSVDLNLDGSFAGDPVLLRYSDRPDHFQLQVGDRVVGIVVTDIHPAGTYVTFGFDLNGHGTALASIVAASGPEGYRGLVPEADVIAVKALDSNGSGTWSNVLAGINYALDRGASVVLIGAAPSEAPPRDQWLAVQKRASSLGATLVLPAGNEGPGAGTVRYGSSSSSALIVGGYVPAESGGAVYGATLPGDIWYPISSCGPDEKNGRGVDVLAPAVAAVPQLKTPQVTAFRVMDGTSVSAAYAAGLALRLRQVAGIRPGSGDGWRVGKALSEGALPLPGLLPVEQGNGRISLEKALALLRAGSLREQVLFARKWDGEVLREGVWSRGAAIGAFPFWIDNFLGTCRTLNLSSSASWLRTSSLVAAVPGLSQQKLWAYGESRLEPGFYSAEVVADDPSTPVVDARLYVHASIPRQFDPAQAGVPSLQFDMRVPDAARAARQFIQVPASAQSMRVTIEGSSAGYSYFLYNPRGVLVTSGTTAPDSVSFSVGLPSSGVWQLCIAAPVNAQPKNEVFRIQVRLGGIVVYDLGDQYGTQHLVITSSRDIGLNLTAMASRADLEWRRRLSTRVSTSAATVISLPAIGSDCAGISLRIGTSSGSTVNAYLYRFAEDDVNWVELYSTKTKDTGTAEIYAHAPSPGKYIAYIEPFSDHDQAYVEIDLVVLRKESPAESGITPIPIKLSGKPEDAFIPLIDRPDDPRHLVLLHESGRGVMGIIERSSSVNKSEVPVVQVMGGEFRPDSPGLRTVRAWARDDARPLDVTLQIGGAKYQLDGGKVTAYLQPGDPVVYQCQNGTTVVLGEVR